MFIYIRVFLNVSGVFISTGEIRVLIKARGIEEIPDSKPMPGCDGVILIARSPPEGPWNCSAN
jgi:hypothetical protein